MRDMRVYREVLSGSHPRPNLGQPRRSLSPAERLTGGKGSRQGGRNWGG